MDLEPIGWVRSTQRVPGGRGHGWDKEITSIELDSARVGILAQRYSHRPNRIGVSRCQIQAVAGLTVHVGGLDAIDGTPVLDIKPWMAEHRPRGDVRQPAWSREVMADYWTGDDR